jgi:hypothetical protein
MTNENPSEQKQPTLEELEEALVENAMNLLEKDVSLNEALIIENGLLNAAQIVQEKDTEENNK